MAELYRKRRGARGRRAEDSDVAPFAEVVPAADHAAAGCVLYHCGWVLLLPGFS